MTERLRQFAAAMGLLTRLPIWRLVPDAPARFAAAIWAYPVVGALVGGIGGLVYALSAQIGLPPSVASVWTIGALVLVTGGLHEDGLADTADGLGGGSTPDRKLAIMRDSRIGSYGALALLLALGVRVAALAQIGSVLGVAATLVVAGAVSRAAIVVVLLVTGPARKDGMAAGLSHPPGAEALAGLGFAALLTVLVVPASALLPIVGVLAAVAIGMAWLARAQIGGHTGDILGATAVLAECLVVSVLAR